MTDGSGGSFATTQWHLVYEAARGDEPGGLEALAELCRAYRHPLYGYLRRKGLDQADAEDTLHSFLVRLIDTSFLEAADPKRGRFRSFLCTSLRHFLANQRRAEQSQRRGGSETILPLDLSDAEQRYAREPVDPQATPEEAFDRQWAWTLVETAVESLRAEWHQGGKGELFDCLRFAISPGAEPESYADLALRFGMTEGAIKVAVHRLRQECGRRIRDEIRRTVVDESETDDELGRLFRLLGK